MSKKLRDTPEHAIAWVRATVLGMTLSGTLACGGSHDVAPTCGPCCHGGGPNCEEQMMRSQGAEDVDEAEEVDAGIETEEPIDTAPTCGPCCHGGGGPECEPVE